MHSNGFPRKGGMSMAGKDRQILVLKHVVEQFVRTNRPVGSGALAQGLNLSSASIRNTMSDLEREGLLEQPHTSAGRVPTDAGYRFFVDYLIGEYRLAEDEGRMVQETLDVLHMRLDALLADITALLSGWSECLAFVAVPEMERCEIQRVDLTPVSAHRALLLVVLSNGMVENRLVALRGDAGRMPLDRIAQRLNERLHGRHINAVSGPFLESVFAEIRLSEQELYNAVMAFFETVILSLSQRVFVDGTEAMIAQPEFQDAATLRPVLEAMRDHNAGRAIYRIPTSERLPEITIGVENSLEELRACSIIKSHFRFGDSTTGAVGLLGPRRMHYARLSSLVRYVAESLSRALSGASLD